MRSKNGGIKNRSHITHSNPSFWRLDSCLASSPNLFLELTATVVGRIVHVRLEPVSSVTLQPPVQCEELARWNLATVNLVDGISQISRYHITYANIALIKINLTQI